MNTARGRMGMRSDVRRGSDAALAVIALAYVAALPLNETPVLGRSVTAAVGALAIVVWGYQLIAQPSHLHDRSWKFPRWAPIGVLACITLLAFLSQAWSWHPEATESRSVQYLLLLAALPALSRGLDGLGQRAINAFLIGAFPLAIITVRTYFSVTQEIVDARGTGLGLNQNEVALFLAIGTVFALHSLVTTSKIAARAVYLVIVFVLVVGCLSTGSRSGMLSLMVGVLITPLIVQGLRFTQVLERILVLLIAVIPAAALLWLNRSVFPTRLVEVFSDLGNDDLSGREDFWWVAFNSTDLYLPWGIGSGAGPTWLGTVGGYWMSFHNTYLQLLVELGVVGILMACLIPISIALAAHASEYRPYVILGLAAWFTQSFAGSLDYSKITWILAALAMARPLRITESEARPETSSVRQLGPPNAPARVGTPMMTRHPPP